VQAETLREQGWEESISDKFTGSLGSLWLRKHGEVRGGFFAGMKQTNERGVVHGGALMTLSDIVLGYAVGAETGCFELATAQLSLQFLSAARIGDFVVCEPQILRVTSRIVFTRGILRVDDRLIASADGLVKRLSAG
jgi:acyl-coenzyme A thioesterase PaaI-like protein